MSGRMSDAQFGRLSELLKLCEKKEIDISIRHRIALEVAHSGSIDALMQELEAQILDGVIPMTCGIPRKVTLISNSQGYGPLPGEDEEVVQRVTINDKGRVFISYYNYLGIVLRKEQQTIPASTAMKLLQDINTTFAVRVFGYEVTDVGEWDLTITNSEGRGFFFRGPLFYDGQSPLASLSDNLREALDNTMLYAFDGQSEELLQFVSVSFDFGSKEYCYLADDKSLAVGDTVEVPVGNANRISAAVITAIEYSTEDDAPFPVDAIKRIIRKREPDLPADFSGTPFEIIKRIIDHLDPESLLEIGAPPDEYDGESKAIADLLSPDMTPQQIAAIMAEEFSSSFSDHFDPSYFIVAATKVKEALQKQ